MKKQLILLITLTLIVTVIISACGSPEQVATIAPTSTTEATEPAVFPSPTATPDPCAPENIQAEAEKVHRIMREFDDAYNLASVTPREILTPTITEMQRIRRDAEDQRVPSCMTTLKQYQLAYMNTAIGTTLYILDFENTEDDLNTLSQGVALARQQHDQYVLELANVLGLTVVAAPTAVPTQGTLEAGETPAPVPLVIINPGPTAVNLRDRPDLNAGNIGLLDVAASLVVLGRTADALWYQVEFPGQAGQTAWVYASLVQLSNPNAELPIIAP